MKICRSCGAELPDVAAFCQACGTPVREEAGPAMGNQIAMPKTIIYLVMIALAVMGILTIGLAARGPNTVTTTNVVTQMQMTTVSIGYTSSETMTIVTTMSMGGTATTAPVGPPPIWFNQQYCGYPFNPNLCNEGPPVTVTGYLTNDTSCVTLYNGAGETYVVWNLPETLPSGAYQVYGYIYPNWPQTQPFPPYPFQQTICIGTPMWSIPPYIKSY